MTNRYCILLDNNKIYIVENITNNHVILKKGNMKIHTTQDKIQMLPENYTLNTNTSRTNVKISSCDVPNEIMLRHKYKEEAIQELDKYIDQALVAKLGRIRIIHGKHGGVLRTAVHDYLKDHPYIKDFYIADYSEGGIGVTIAIIGKKK